MTTTTITIDVELRDQLRAMGRMGETYSDVLRRLFALAHTRQGLRIEDRGGWGPSPTKTWSPLQERQ